jgi:hypothetical protein
MRSHNGFAGETKPASSRSQAAAQAVNEQSATTASRPCLVVAKFRKRHPLTAVTLRLRTVSG